MSRVTFSQEDILRSKLLPPAWYPVLVKSYAKEQAGTDGSDLHVFSLVVETGPFAGVPVRNQISEKALGMGIEFVEACGVPVQAGVAIEFDKLVGKKLDMYSQRGEYKGKPNNQAVTFRLRKA